MDILEKYRKEVTQLACISQYYSSLPTFIENCRILKKEYLQTYIATLAHKFKENIQYDTNDLIFSIEELLRNILYQNHENIEILQTLLDILHLTVLMSDKHTSETICKQYLLDYFPKDDDTKAEIYLQIFLVIWNVLPSVVCPNIQVSISRLFYSDSKSEQINSLMCIRTILTSSSSIILLESIWNDILGAKYSKSLQSITSLSFLLDFFVDIPISGNILQNNPKFWLYLQEEFISIDPFIQKQSYFILRKMNENVPNELLEAWNFFFTIYETLNEKQSHLILPALALLTKIKELPLNWIYLLLVLIVRHENMLVSEYGIHFIMDNIRFSNEDILTNYGSKQLLNAFLAALNDTYLYSNNKISAENLTNIFAPIFDIIRNDLANIEWRSVPLYYIIETISLLPRPAIFENNEYVNFVKEMLRITNRTPNVAIRNGIKLMFQTLLTVMIKEMVFQDQLHDFNCNELCSKSTDNVIDILLASINIDIVRMLNSFLTDHTLDKIVNLINNPDIPEFIKIQCLAKVRLTDDELKQLFCLMINQKSKYFRLVFQNHSDCLHDLITTTLHMQFEVFYNTQEYSDINVIEMVLSIYDLYYIEYNSNTDRELFVKDILKLINNNQERPMLYHKYLLAKLLFSNYLNPQKMVFNVLYLFMEPDQLNIYKTTIDLNMVRDIQKMIYRFIQNQSECIDIDSDILRSICTTLVNLGSSDDLMVAMHIIKNEYLKRSMDHEEILDLCFTEIMTYKRKEPFLHLIHQYLDILNNISFPELQQKYYLKLMEISPNSKGLIYVMTNFEFITLHLDFIEMALTHGKVAKGDQRFEAELCGYIYGNSLPKECLEGPYIRGAMHQLIRHPEFSKEKIKILKNIFLEKSAVLYASKSRYFVNSHHHRLKLRIVQALATLFSCDKTWDDRLLIALFEDSNQLNITYIMECIIATTIDIKRLHQLIEQANSNHARQSVFIIMFYVCSFKNDCILTCECIETMLTWTMGQHFNTRMTAQVVIIKMIEKFNLKDQYRSIYDGIKRSFTQGNGKQNSDKLFEDFRLNHLKCTDLLNPIYYLYEIPRLTVMASEDIIPLHSISGFNEINNYMLIKLDPIPISKHFIENDVYDISNVQKKIIPIKEIFPDTDFLDSLSKNLQIHKTNIEGLVVVASLISRSPNLGGLCRTCEIFGAVELIVDSLKQVEKKEFQSLSMTSEKWLKIGEVKPWHLIEYISTMKGRGYCIIGAEQTANGKQLTEVQFPKKTVLILGHEKEGIPANLIALLDIAVEIPQFGVVRSLNVHVTGALFIWEYVKQHSLHK